MDASLLDPSAQGVPDSGVRDVASSCKVLHFCSLLRCRPGRAVSLPRCDVLNEGLCDKRLQESLFVSCSASVLFGFCCQTMLLFASQTAQGGPTVILPALLITGLLVAASQAFVPKGGDQD